MFLIPDAGILKNSIYKENKIDEIETQLFNPIQSTHLKYISVHV